MDFHIKIPKSCSLEMVDCDWTPELGAVVRFEITQESGFQLFAEGAAIGKIRDIQLAGNPIYISLPSSFKLPTDEAPLEGSLPPILFSIFGLELLHVSQGVVTDSATNDPEAWRLRNELGSYVWDIAKSGKGVMRSGKAVYLVSRHGSEIPAALRDQPSPTVFPKFDSFRKNIAPHIAGLRDVEAGIGASEAGLVEWLFHVSENAFEHASFTTTEQGRHAIDGYRGIILQKIILNRIEELDLRSDIPQIAKNYIQQRINDGDAARQLVFITMTVADIGVGVQGTIPNEEDDQSSIELLRLAFQNGVTSKPLNKAEKAGYGLGDMAEAARQLRALLFIVTGNLVAYYDFTDEPEKRLPSQDLSVNELGLISKNTGTSMSIIWTYNPERSDQLGLNL